MAPGAAVAHFETVVTAVDDVKQAVGRAVTGIVVGGEKVSGEVESHSEQVPVSDR